MNEVNETSPRREGVGEREFPVEEGRSLCDRWKTVGFQVVWRGGNDTSINSKTALRAHRAAV